MDAINEQKLYKYIFNKASKIFIIVTTRLQKNNSFNNTTLAFLFFTIGILSSTVVLADIVADPAAPANQRPTISTSPNDIPLVNIQTPSKAGVSRNTYKQFDVNPKGAILNNSRKNVKTELGGWVQGNPWLASGSAKVILNEVNSSDPSYLKGYLEVAGQRAQVVIANPSGITCSNCGFINANRATLTTGIAIMKGGNLESYRVEGGNIVINGEYGLDTSTTDYTDIIAKSIKVNAKIWADELKITAGTNTINADNTQASKITMAKDNKPAYAIDVAHLGGMYAEKIILIGTQEGVGVRNAGTIGANAGDVIINTNGFIKNNGNIWSQLASVQLTAQGNIDSQAGSELSANKLKISSNSLNNRGLLNAINTEIDVATLNNLGTGRIYGDHISINATTVNNDNENGEAAVIAARSRLDIGAKIINNRDHSLLFSAGNIALGGAINGDRHATDLATIINNVSATIESLGDMSLSADKINNLNKSITTIIVPSKPEDIVEYQLQPGHLYAGKYLSAEQIAKRYKPDEITTFSCFQVACYRVKETGLTSDAAYEHKFERIIYNPVVTESDPAKILAGNNLTISADTMLNDKSQLLAKGIIADSINTLKNENEFGPKTTVEVGTSTKYFRIQKSGSDKTGIIYTSYKPTPTVEMISILPAVYEANTKTNSTNTILTGGIDPNVTNNSLFISSPKAPNEYIIETDPAFASYRNWLSSDYLLDKMSHDPVTTQKRLGDGFYEQMLVREQVAMLTGRRFLEGYSDDEEQYRRLMQEGALFAKTFNIKLGIALTPRQMAQLTSDIVWLVEKTMTLANGQTVQALVPELYVQVKKGDLLAANGLISADDKLSLNISGDLNNMGHIAGRKVVDISAANINNLNGYLTGDFVSLNAENDLHNVGGNIKAKELLDISAKGNVQVASTTSTQQNAQGMRTNISRIAGLYVENENGLLKAKAGKDFILKAANIESAGSISLGAENDVKMETLTTQEDHLITFDKDNFLRQYNKQEVGNSIQSMGDMSIQAGRDLKAKASKVSSAKGELKAAAVRNIEISSAENMQGIDSASKIVSKGFMSKRTVTTRLRGETLTQKGSSFVGKTVNIQAGNNVAIEGSNVISDANTKISAEQDVNIKETINSSWENSFRQEKKSGIFSSGAGFTIGKQQQDLSKKSSSKTAASSTVGSIKGDIIISAGQNYRQKSSEIIAPQGNVDILAKEVDIIEAQNTSQSKIDTKFKQSGLTVSVGSPIISAGQTIDQTLSATKQTNDPRMQALAAGSLALGAYNNAEAVTNAAKSIISGDITGAGNVSISLGSSKSSSSITQTQSMAVMSEITSGKDINIEATDTDVNIKGSSLFAKENIELKAKESINLIAAKNASQQSRTNKSSGASLGVTLSSNNVGFVAGTNSGRGNAEGEDVSWANTKVAALKEVNLSSNKDTTLKGATVSANRVKAEVAGNLSIQSLQDSSTFKSKQKNVTANISVSPNSLSGGVGGGISDVTSDFISVTEQSSIKAGDAGFNVKVDGDTGLIGGAITSTQEAITNNNNVFNTKTLTTSDVYNEAHYKGKAIGVNIGAGFNPEGKLVPQSTSAGLGKDSGSAKSVTTSAISDIAGNKEARTGDADTGIQQIFDADKVLKKINSEVYISRNFGREAGVRLNQLATKAEKEIHLANIELNKERAKPENERNLAKISQLEESIENNKIWKVGGVGRNIMQALTSAVTGSASGAVGEIIQAATINYMQSLAAQKVKEIADNLGSETARAALHAIIACAGAIAKAASCETAATAASASVVINNLLSETHNKDGSSMSDSEKIARSELVNNIITGIAAGTNADIVTAITAAKIETENNYLYPNEKKELITLLEQCETQKCKNDAHYLKNPKEYVLLPDAKAVFHTFETNEKGKVVNVLTGQKDGYAKWVHPTYGYEVVLDANNNIVTDSLNAGTYNFYNPNMDEVDNSLVENSLWHALYDIAPYYREGNAKDDVSSLDDRLARNIYGILPRILTKTIDEHLKMRENIKRAEEMFNNDRKK